MRAFALRSYALTIFWPMRSRSAMVSE